MRVRACIAPERARVGGGEGRRRTRSDKGRKSARS